MDNFRENNLDSGLGAGEEKKSRKKAILDFFWEMTKVAVISLLIILPVRYFIMQPFYVKGASMEPNFYDHEYLIVDEITYRFFEPKRGDIVVFQYPFTKPNEPKQYYIKRVIGLPGETIKVKDGEILVGQDENDLKPLTEAYLPQGTATNLLLRGYSDVKLGADEYFLLGDNRDQSSDSRVFGPIKREFIVGRTWVRVLPFNRMTVFGTPEYKK